MFGTICALSLLLSQKQPGHPKPVQYPYRVIESISLPGMENNSELRIELRKYREPQSYDTGVGLFTVTPLGTTRVGWSMGGLGLMCTLKADKYLYFVYSWGSGIHRSCIERLSVNGNDFKYEMLGSFPYYDLRLSICGSDIRIDSGSCLQLNMWDHTKLFGWIVVRKGKAKFLQPDKTTPIKDTWKYCWELSDKWYKEQLHKRK